MNWLAHLFLSETAPAARIGNILPDLVPAVALASVPADFQRGITQHHRIDAFTDVHPVVRRSIQRIPPPFRRFGGVLTDLFYDHFLARDWSLYSSEPLSEFAGGIYTSFHEFRALIPVNAYTILEQMKAADWLGSYRDVAGIARALERVSLRLGRSLELGAAISVLQRDYEAFGSDFHSFFPELQAHVMSPVLYQLQP